MTKGNLALSRHYCPIPSCPFLSRPILSVPLRSTPCLPFSITLTILYFIQQSTKNPPVFLGTGGTLTWRALTLLAIQFLYIPSRSTQLRDSPLGDELAGDLHPRVCYSSSLAVTLLAIHGLSHPNHYDHLLSHPILTYPVLSVIPLSGIARYWIEQ